MVVSGTEGVQRVVEHVGVTTVLPLLQATARRGHAAETVGHGAETETTPDQSNPHAHALLL